MFWYILFVTVVLYILVSHWQERHLIKLSQQLKSDIKTIPVLGHGYLIGNKVKNMTEIQRFGREANKHGGLTYLRLLNLFAVVVTDPEVVGVISKRCLEKHYVMKLLEPVIGNGSLIASVPMWRHRRKIISQTFRQSILNQFVNRIFSQQSVVMTELLRELDGEGSFSIWNYINTYTFDSVFEAILGVQLKAQYDPEQPFLKAFEKCSELIAARAFRPWLYPTAIYRLLPQYLTLKRNSKLLNDFIDQRANEHTGRLMESVYGYEYPQYRRNCRCVESWHRTTLLIGRGAVVLPQVLYANPYKASPADQDQGYRDYNQIQLKPFLELLLESADGERPVTDLECREELLVLALAATDTSAVGASFTAVMLSRHPDVQEKAYQELQEVFGETDRLVEAEDLLKLNYLQAVIKETLRLYPPVPLVARNIEKDISLPSGITLHKGVGVVFDIWGIHRNPQYWSEDADVFKPERFLDATLKHPAAFMPFSFGPRNCPGHKYSMMSITTLMATLLRSYQLLPATPADGNGSDNPDINCQPLRLKYDIMMKDVDGFKVRIKTRV